MEKQNVKTEVNIIDQREVLGKDFRIYGNFENPLFLAKDVAIWIEYNKDNRGIFNPSHARSLPSS